MPVRALVVAVLAGALCLTAAVSAAPRASRLLDVELAIDTTGSMGPSIRLIQRDAKKLVVDVRQRSPGVHFAVVQFKDAGDTPEYELLQSMTGDPKAIDAALAQLGPGGGGDNPEAYNVVFRNSYADRSTGWRDAARKLVVVIGDAEPHGAGTAGFGGCLDASADPHGLRTRQELIGMRSNQRTLVMIRQASTATVALACYQSLAAAAYRGGGARDGGSDLIGAIESMIARAAAIAPAPVVHATTRSSGADHTPPRVQAIKSGGYRGTTIRLFYRVADDSGRSSDRIAVYAGSRLLTRSGWAPFGPATGKAYYFDFPAPLGMAGTFSFCVQSRDPSGNVSKPACAPLIVQ